MRGYCKCDLCGRVYNETENAAYDGITVWRKSKDGENRFPVFGAKLCTQSGEPFDDMPAVTAICPNCFELFYSWIGIQRRGIEKPCK